MSTRLGVRRLKRRVSITLAAVAATFAFSAVASADSLGPVDFEALTPGDINGQGGWSKTGAFDVEVENVSDYPAAAAYGFGTKALRASNAVTSGSFGDQTFSPNLAQAAGESGRRRFETTFSIGTALASHQSGLRVTVSPDDGSGGRITFLAFRDETDGLHVDFADADNPGPLGTATDFPETDIAILDRATAHDVRMVVDFIPGPNNDVVRVFIDGILEHTGGTWEDYYRFDPEQSGGGNVVPVTDALLVRVNQAAVPGNAGNGVLFDDVALSSSTPTTYTVNDNNAGPGPAGADCANPDFDTIQEGIDAATAGSTILVCAGIYAENVTLNKDLTLVGAQGGVDARGRVADESIVAPGVGVGVTLVAGSAGSTIDGFTFSGDTRGIESGSGPLNGLLIRNNRVVDFTSAGVFLNDSGTDVTLHQNVVDGSSKVGSGGLVHLDTDAFDGFRFTDNNVVNGPTGTGFFSDGNRNVGLSSVRAPSLSGNLFSGNLTGVNLGSRSFEDARITGNTVSDNVSPGMQGGMLRSLISGNTFANNGRGGLELTSFGNSDPTQLRGAISNVIERNSFTGNGFTAGGQGISFSATQAPGTISSNTIRFNRIAGNSVGATYAGGEVIDAVNNWWGCNGGPGQAGCDTVGGAGAANVDTNPWLVLGGSASAGTVPIGGQSQITASLTRNSAGQVAGSGFPDNVSVAFGATAPHSVSPANDLTDAGRAQTLFTAGAAIGATNATITLDGQAVQVPLTVVVPPQGPAGPAGPQGPAGDSGGVAGTVGGSKKKCKKGKKLVGKKCKKIKKK